MSFIVGYKQAVEVLSITTYRSGEYEAAFDRFDVCIPTKLTVVENVVETV